MLGLEKGTSVSMYHDKFSNTDRPIPKNPDMDIIYLANNKDVDIGKLNREQKKKLLEFTTKERNYKLKADDKEDVVNNMLEHDKNTIRNAIDGKPEPKVPEEIQKARFTDPETQASQPSQQETPSRDIQTTQPSQQETQPSQQQSQTEEQKQGPTGEKSIVTKIKPDGNVTVITKLLKGEDGKDFIVDAKTKVNGQNGINTIVNLAKKLNREAEFVK